MSIPIEGSSFDHPSKTFLGVHFVLIGFDPVHKIKVQSKLVDGGGVDVAQYGPNCTHVIVDQLVYDDPICVAARNDGKILVTALWVDHSFDIGMPITPFSIVYRPLKDLNGIPGAKSLIVCLTGYQRQDRDDIMTMVGLMGANFLKPLVASKVTHLVCFKFEGEKYELAKKTKKIKLVNHRWLEDCLKAWEILPETGYDKSGYEMEIMEAVAKDSEDTPETINMNHNGGEVASSHLCQQISKQKVSMTPLDSNASKGLSNAGNANDIISATGKETVSDEAPNLHEIHNTNPKVLGSCETTTLRGGTCANDFASTSRIGKRSPCSDESKKYAISYTRKTPRKTAPPLFSEKDGTDFSSVKSTPKGTEFLLEEEQNSFLPGKRKLDMSSSGGSKSQKTSQNPKAFIPEGSLAVNRPELIEISSTIIGRAGTNNRPSHGNDNSYSNGTSVLNLPQNSPIKISTRLSASFEKESLTPGRAWEPDIVREDIEFSLPRTKTSEVKKSGSSAKVDLLNGGDADEHSKPLGTKMFSKKFMRSRRNLGKGNATDEKGSDYSTNSALQNDSLTYSVGGKRTSDHKLINSEKLPAVNVDTVHGMKKNDDRKSGKKVESISVFKDGENEFVVAAGKEKCGEVGPDKIDCMVPSDNDKDGTQQESILCGKKTEQGESTNLKNTMKEKITKRKKHTSRKLKKKIVRCVKKITNINEAANKEAESERNNEMTEMKDDSVPQERGEIKRIVIGDKLEKSVKLEENMPMVVENVPQADPVVFILSGHKLQRKEFQQVIRRLKGRVCRDSHQWSYQATHFIVPYPIRRTEKFCAAAASGRWILKSDYLTASKQEGKFLSEEPYEWHQNGLSEDGAINLQAPRKWRLLRERTGHGAFYGMRIIIYGDCIVPPLDTLKRVVKAGDGTILATSPPYSRFLKSGVDFAIVSAGMPHVDTWIQEFLRHEIPCVLADYLVEYVCKPGYPLERHVQFNTHAWAEKSFKNLVNRVEEIIEDATTLEDGRKDGYMMVCHVCGSREGGEAMVICGHKTGSSGCGVATHVDCCDPPLECIPEEEWWCPKCSIKGKNGKKTQKNSKKRTYLSKRK